MADRRTILSVLFSFVVIAYSSEYPGRVLDVTINCPASASGTAELNITSDRPVRVTLECLDNATYDAQQYPNQLGVYNGSVSFTGNSAEACLFWKMANSDTYTISVRVTDAQFLEEDEHKYSVACTYDKHKAGIQSVEEMYNSLAPSNQLETHLGHIANSTFSIELQDILGRVIHGKIPIRKKIRLFIRMTSGSDNEQGFTVKHCDASNGDVVSYRILTSGCGDGHILQGDKGFSSDGLTASSPYFRSFRLHGSDTVSFECTFSTCKKACNGDSCNRLFRGRRRRRRSKRDGRGVEAINNEDQHIKTAALVIEHHRVINAKKQRSQRISSLRSQKISISDIQNRKQYEQSRNLPWKPQREQSKIPGKIYKSRTISKHIKHLKKFRKYMPMTTPKLSLEVSNQSSPPSIKELNAKSKKIVGKLKKGLTYEQTAALIGCIMFLVMVGVFLCITFYYTKQKNNFEKKFWTVRAADNQGGSRTYLLDDIE